MCSMGLGVGTINAKDGRAVVGEEHGSERSFGCMIRHAIR